MNFIKKHGRVLIAIALFVIMTIGIIYIEKKFYQGIFCIDRYILYFLGEIFVLINVLCDYKKVWHNLFKYRYIIGVCLFVIMVALGYSTSSVGQYNSVIQPNYTKTCNTPIWGVSRGIRSDEFLAGTPALLSQELEGTFSKTNDEIMATEGSVLLFPKLTTLNISVLSSPNLLGFIFLDEERGFSFYSLLNYFLAFFGVFELLMMLTNAKEDNEEDFFKNKKFLSFIGTLLLVFSPVVLWWGCQTYLAYGSLCIIFLEKLLLAKNKKKKWLFSILLGLFGSCFVGLAYPAWQVPFGYLYLGLMLWIFIRNWKKIDKKNLWYLIPAVCLVGIILAPAFLGSKEELELMNNTVYPGQRLSLGGDGWEFLFLWFPATLYGYSNVGNPCEFSQFISLFPIPFIMAVYELIKNRKQKSKDIYLIILVILTVLLGIWNFIPIGVFAKISLLYMSTTQRAQIVIGIINILILLRLIEKYSLKKFDIKRLFAGFIIGFVTVTIAVYASNILVPGYLTPIKTCVLAMLFFTLITLLVLNYKNTNSIVLIVLGLLSIFCFFTIVPIQKGLSVLNDKPVSKQIREINDKDDESIWISANTSLYMSNFVLANGSRVINSVNYYPNLKLWHKIDTNKKYEDVYNRYAHINISITEKEDSEFELIQGDYFVLNTNINDVCKLGVDYIGSSDDSLEKYNNNKNSTEKIYGKDDVYIYKLNCGD